LVSSHASQLDEAIDEGAGWVAQWLGRIRLPDLSSVPRRPANDDEPEAA
jgi:hypothetical protein